MRSSTKNNLLIAACYALALTLGMIIGPKFSRDNTSNKNGSFFYGGTGTGSVKIEKVLEIIQDNYVDEVKTDTLQASAIEEILSHLDPHSHYLPPTESNYLNEDLEGEFNGIGIEYNLVNDTLLVTYVNETGPAHKAGIKSGDQILKIDKRAIAGSGIKKSEIVDLIRGRRGTGIDLLVKRMSNPARLIHVIRDRITVSSIDIAYMLTNSTGYIKISKFGANTDKDFIAALSSLQSRGMKNLVLDLRENGGGYLNAATAIADQFLKDNQLIVFTQGKHEPRTNYTATGKGKFEKGKLVVLIDENSASASEILAGAIQDLDRGTIIGRRSFGKGLVQEQFNFSDGSTMNLTVARYYTPSGRSIQKPYSKGAEAYYSEVNRRYENGELKSDGKHLPDSIFDRNKTYKTASGRLIYGGGGIMPDIYVPIDTSAYTDFYYEVSARGLLEEFLFKYLVKEFNFSNPAQYLKSFTVSDTTYNKIISLAYSKGIKAGKKVVELSRPAINKELKALLGRYYFGNDMYYQVINDSDRVIARSLAVLN
ncbi:S41 family peptidase [Rubrolithibacter danxiaensis]|uniref:S41 family peptidase n=1 Tax=Rubrolithibacter danxiaensis TaxID=3390805 RepID=UPI003BF841BA